MEETKHDSVLDARESIQVENLPEWMDKECLGEDLSSNWLDANQELEMPEYMLSWRGVGFFPLGSINAITGHKKNGKTMFETLLMVACLKDGEQIGPLRYELHEKRPNPKVLFIDTEQEMSYSLMVQRRVHYLMGWDFRVNNERFKVLWLHNELTAKERYNKMCQAIYTMRPDFIILDGSRDMIKDINDAEESTSFVRRTMKMATDNNSVLAQALHYNPGSEKMRGWLGTELGNRVAYTAELTKEKKEGFVKFISAFVDCRGKDVDDIEFYINDSVMKFGIPALMNNDAVMQELDRKIQEQDKVDLRKKFAFMGARTFTYWTTIKKLRELHNIGSDTAQKCLTDAVRYGILLDCGENKYKLNLSSDGEQQKIESDDDMPF